MSTIVEEVLENRERRFLVTTPYVLDHLQGRDDATALTPFFADQFVESIRNLDNLETLIMTGYASTLANVVDILERIDVPSRAGTRLDRTELQDISDQLIQARRN